MVFVGRYPTWLFEDTVGQKLIDDFDMVDI